MNENQYFVANERPASRVISDVMKRVYFKMFLALIVTALVSMWAAGSEAFQGWIYDNRFAMWILLGAEVLLVIAISGSVTRMRPAMATALFFLFSIVNGLALSSIFWVYTEESIAKTFFITAGTFGAMSVYGYFTTNDLSKIGSILIMALIGLIICSVVNIFLESSPLEWIISGVGVLIFIGLTAWDTQKIKRMAEFSPDTETDKRLATIGALSLYLDFINLFLYLLRFFGGRN